MQKAGDFCLLPVGRMHAQALSGGASLHLPAIDFNARQLGQNMLASNPSAESGPEAKVEDGSASSPSSVLIETGSLLLVKSEKRNPGKAALSPLQLSLFEFVKTQYQAEPVQSN